LKLLSRQRKGSGLTEERTKDVQDDVFEAAPEKNRGSGPSAIMLTGVLVIHQTLDQENYDVMNMIENKLGTHHPDISLRVKYKEIL
jgi:hypothetical protein